MFWPILSPLNRGILFFGLNMSLNGSSGHLGLTEAIFWFEYDATETPRHLSVGKTG